MVQKGDTLYSIAHEFGVRLDLLLDANDIEDPTSLAVGTPIRIPGAHTVSKGDTLWSISRAYETTVGVLRELNGYAGDVLLQVGNLVIVPGASRSVAVDAIQDVEAGLASSPESQTATPSMINGVPFWPIEGIRSRRGGKISGTEIIGRDGDLVYAVSAGVVVWNAPNLSFGRTVIVESSDLYLYLYGGAETVAVEIGQRVAAGASIGSLTLNPNTGEARLFFTVYRDGEIIDAELAPRG